jgi:hypothetical protein
LPDHSIEEEVRKAGRGGDKTPRLDFANTMAEDQYFDVDR